MAQVTRQVANRQHVADLLKEAAKDIRAILRKVRDAQQLLQELEGPKGKVATAKKLAEAKPTPSSRALPAPIRRRVDRAAATLERLSQEVRQVPVTAEERVLAKRRRAKKAQR